MTMTPRLTQPDAKNRFYIAKSEGGLNPGVPRPNGSKLPFANCVFYALGRFAELWGIWLKSTNAENFISAAKEAGLQTGNVPVPGSIAVWAKGKVGVSSDGAGHVAVVELVNADGSITTSESGWSAGMAFWTQTRKHDGNWGQSAAYRFIGFVLPPNSNPYPVPTRTLREHYIGQDVKWLQAALKDCGCYTGAVDGVFGTETLKAVLLFQHRHGLEADGMVGPKTRAAILNTI